MVKLEADALRALPLDHSVIDYWWHDHRFWVAPECVLAEDKVGQSWGQSTGLLDRHLNSHNQGILENILMWGKHIMFLQSNRN